MLNLLPAFPLLAVYRGNECPRVPEACTLPNMFFVTVPSPVIRNHSMAPKWSAKAKHIPIGKHRAVMKTSKPELRKHGLSKYNTERRS